jgi:hypothetical protein
MPASESPGTLVDPATALTRELEINGQVFAGRLSLSCRFSAQRHRVQRIEALLAAVGDALQALIDDTPATSVPSQQVTTTAAPSPLLHRRISNFIANTRQNLGPRLKSCFARI